VSVANPRDLLLQLLSELLWIERTLYFEILPKLHDDSHAPELQLAFTEHRGETREHGVRLEAAFRAAGAEPAAARSATLAAAAQQHEQEAKQITSPTLKDTFHAMGAMRGEHLELALYDAAIQLADGECRKLLEQNRKEDAQALERLTAIAERTPEA
jgi:ferritin-like metal-binding protein YciE